MHLTADASITAADDHLQSYVCFTLPQSNVLRLHVDGCFGFWNTAIQHKAIGLELGELIIAQIVNVGL
jgi:hypothetical protein